MRILYESLIISKIFRVRIVKEKLMLNCSVSFFFARYYIAPMKNLTIVLLVCFFPIVKTLAGVKSRIIVVIEAAAPDSTRKPASFLNAIGMDIVTALDDGVELGTAPSRFDTKDWLVTGCVIGGTALALTGDKDVRSVMLRNKRSDAFDVLLPLGNAYGNGALAVAAGAGLYFGGLLADHQGVRETGAMTIEALAYAGVITTVVKTVFGRSRPYTDEGPSRYRWFQLQNKYLALPSGHCTVAFAFSTVLSQQLDFIPATMLLYGLAGVTAFQRLYEDQHWFSDTVLGSCIGYFIGDAVVMLHRKHKSRDQQSSFILYPVFSNQAAGMGVALRF